MIICLIKRNTCRGTLILVPLIPLFSSFAFFGVPGILNAALLLGFFFLFREVLGEITKHSSLIFRKNTQSINIYKNIIKPYKLYWPFLPVFAIALGIVVAFSQLNLLFLLLAFAAALAIFFFSLKTMSIIGNRKRFNPVMIISRRFPEFAFYIYMMPYITAVFIAIIFTPLISSSYVSTGEFDVIIDEQDYYAHLMYQTNFSTRKLGAIYSYFPHYVFDNDGLPSINDYFIVNRNINMNEFPPFPLKHLMEFFNDVNAGGRTGGIDSTGEITEKLTLLVFLLFLLPLLIIRNSKNRPKVNFSGIKNNFSNFRYTRKKIKTYGGTNKFRILKDA